jgi:O-antigen/teichoic acid export membrane protein
MSSIARETSILIVCRFVNYLVLFASPVVLVRILSVEKFGMYREFMLYAGMIANFAAFSVNKSLIYFLSKYDHDKQYINNSIFLNILITIFVVLFILISKNLIISKTSFDFVFSLLLYLIFFLNLDYCESYWISIRRTNYVLYYTFLRGLIRNIVVILSAYIFSDVTKMIHCLVIVEVIRFILICFYTKKIKSINIKLNLVKLKDQISYILPMGISNFIFYLNKEISKILILYTMGVEYLAIYSVGCYQIPIIGIVRGSIGDIVFSEVCSRSSSNIDKAFVLWKQTNVIYLSVVLPVFFVFFFYAKEFITIFFTEKYLESIIIFKIYMFLMLKECFETGIPIRMLNKNKFYIYAYNYSFFINIISITILSLYFKFVGPAVAYVISDTFVYIYLGKKILDLSQIKISKLFYWKKISYLFISSTVLVPILYVGELFNINLILKIVIFSTIYLIIYSVTIVNLKIEEVDIVYKKIINLLIYIKKRCISHLKLEAI